MPLGVCSLKSYLVKNGQDATVLDLNMKTYIDSENKELWADDCKTVWSSADGFKETILPKLDITKMLEHILSRNADIIGFSINNSTEYISVILTKEIKKKSKKTIIFGGPGCYDINAEKFLRAGVDAIAIGEGEGTLLEFVQERKLCKGIYMLHDDKVVYGGSRKPLDIDTLPFPDYDDIVDDYLKFSPEMGAVSASFVRGCTNRCSFCNESPFWGKVRQRSPENIVNELKYLKQRYHMQFFNKADSTLAISADSLNKICDLIIESNLNVKWHSQARPEKWLTPELLRKVYQAGCVHVHYGVESGSQKILDLMKKNLNVKVMKQVIKDTDEAGIKASLFIIVDSPKETLIDFIKTVLFLFKLRKHIENYEVSKAGVSYRTDWFLNPGKYGIIDTNPWHTKYYLNNHIAAKLKKGFLDKIKRPILKKTESNRNNY